MTARAQSIRWPNLFVIGAAKAGTTSLYHYIAKHPNVFMPAIKEPHYFTGVRAGPKYRHSSGEIATSEAQYLALFAGVGSQRYVGDASASYLWSPDAPKRIREVSPDAKLIVLIRNPVDRAYSHYRMTVRDGVETLPFAEAWDADMSAEEKGWAVSHQYFELGLYGEQLERYLTFFDRSSLLVLYSDDLSRKRKEVLQRVARFLDLSEEPLIQEENLSRTYNSHGVPRWKVIDWAMKNPVVRFFEMTILSQGVRLWLRDRLIVSEKPVPLDAHMRQRIAELYLEDTAKLERVLGGPVPWRAKLEADARGQAALAPVR